MLPPISLLINIDHIATLRNARGGRTPDPLRAARVCLKAGANGVVCHLREDRRHIRDADVRNIRGRMRARFDLEMAATPEIIRIALRTHPDLVTLVPERRRELTTEGGLNVSGQMRRLQRVVDRFHRNGIPVSLFVDPVRREIRAAHDVGADVVELHTGEYSEAIRALARKAQLKRLRDAAAYGAGLGLGIHAGHGLNYRNTKAVARIPELKELSIGFAVIAHAVEVGLYRAVRDMVLLIQEARHS